jgi:Permeases
MAMSYILLVNPSILHAASVDPKDPFPLAPLVSATAVTAAVSSVAMGLSANLPFGLMPGMGLIFVGAKSVRMGSRRTKGSCPVCAEVCGSAGIS